MSEKKIDFEASVKELEAIVARLESGECPLDESIKLFEKGIALSGKCRRELEAARQKIITLTDKEKEEAADDETVS